MAARPASRPHLTRLPASIPRPLLLCNDEFSDRIVTAAARRPHTIIHRPPPHGRNPPPHRMRATPHAQTPQNALPATISHPNSHPCREFSDRTIIAVAHRLLTIIGSDRVLVLDQGRAAEYDSPKALLDIPNGAFACERSCLLACACACVCVGWGRQGTTAQRRCWTFLMAPLHVS